MAKTRRRSATRKSSRWPYLLVVVLVLLAALWWYYGPIAQGYARTGTAYAARVACSCRFVAGRDLDDCAKDKLAGMEFITLSADEEGKSVTARFPLIASDTARMQDGYGCVLEKWED
ncbi:MAG: hypothetical protein R3E18_04975 [Sphingomonadaceae bacterium]|nr:hypothetical protein [Sphingomonadaceae bacterium]